MHTRLKKRQMEEERQAVIQKDNQILLENMAHIMSTKGRLDNRNEYKQKRLERARVKGGRADILFSATKFERNHATERAHQNNAREPRDPEADSPRRGLPRSYAAGGSLIKLKACIYARQHVVPNSMNVCTCKISVN